MMSALLPGFVASLSFVLLISACGDAPEAPSAPPPEVEVIVAQEQAVPLTRELVGRLSATRVADVRARVAGILQERLYQEGSTVREGQVLFRIDPAPLRAALNATLAALEQAEANAINARVFAARNRELAGKGLLSKASLDEAEANERSTAALVSQAKANVEMARINLGYATVRAPIAGRSGQQRVTEGALVGENEATLLTVIEQIDPIYVNFDQPAAEIARLRRAQSSGDVALVERNKAEVQVVLQDGTPYPHLGKLDFLDFSVDPATGALAYRAVIPNPQHELLPGMFVNVHLTMGRLTRAFLVPQRGVQRDGTGPYVLVAGEDDVVAVKRINAEVMNGTNWIVTGGLEPGDRIIVSGLHKASPGTRVAAVQRQTAASGGSALPAGATAADGSR